MIDVGLLELVLPDVIPDEFARNRERVLQQAKASQGDVLRRARQAMSQYGAAGKDVGLQVLDDVVHKLRLHSDTANETFSRVEDLISTATVIVPDTIIRSRAATRGLEGRAPFRGQKNSLADAVIIETFASILEEEKDPTMKLIFVTENTADFSSPTDKRAPHPDIAGIFDGVRSVYSTDIVEAVLAAQRHSGRPPGWVDDEPEYYISEPRPLSEIQVALSKLLDQMWYNDHRYLAHQVVAGEVRIVEESPTEKGYNSTIVVRDIWEGAQKSARRIEQELEGELGPWDDVEWGMILGKIAALRWALGDEWDLLDN